jgi:hypothetical protein
MTVHRIEKLYFCKINVTFATFNTLVIQINSNNMIEKIGINAGKVWTILDERGRQNVKEVKKAAKLTDKDLYAAIGWLGREGKVVMEEVEKEIYISLS